MTEKLRLNPITFEGLASENAIYCVSVATTGEAAGHGLIFDEKSLEQLAALGNKSRAGIKSRFTHPDWFHDGLGKYLGRVRDFRVQGHKLIADLHLSPVARKSPAGDLAAYVLNLAAEDPSSFGVSVVVDIERAWITSDGQEKPSSNGRPGNAITKYPVARIKNLFAADLVDEPALNPDGLFRSQGSVLPRERSERACQAKREESLNPTALGGCGPDGLFESNPFSKSVVQGESQEMTEQLITEPSVTQSWEEHTDDHSNKLQNRIKDLESQVARLSNQLENQVITIGNVPPRGQQVSMGTPMLDQFQNYFDWLFGAPGAKVPPPDLRRADALYRAVTGDVEMRGVFDPSRVAFANANTTTLADLAVNAMNKVVLDLYTNLGAFRWYELITAVQATDGSLMDMQWLQFGGISNLPVVAEGAAYTELDVIDTKETSAFTKYGGYVGITDKMLRNSQIDRLQAIPRALTISAIRTRSAAIAAIFTQASGTGPTLAQDSTVLFHANHGSNVQTTAFSIAAWKAARLECAKMSELGSSKRQVLWPKYCLVPVDLYDDALIVFGYGQGAGGYPGTPNNDTNVYAVDRPGDTRPVPVAVPEWTDSTDWAYIVDPRIAPVICMAYGDNPGGTSHPAPQLYSVTDPTSGLLFSNDTLPIKVRDTWAYGVATWRGIGKRNVA